MTSRSGKQTHPLHVLSKRFAVARAQDLKLDVRVGAAVTEVHDAGESGDASLCGVQTT